MLLPNKCPGTPLKKRPHVTFLPLFFSQLEIPETRCPCEEKTENRKMEEKKARRAKKENIT